MSFEYEIRYVPTESVLPNPLTTRKHFKRPISKVGRSICEYGFMAPIVVDEINTIVAGQVRWEVAMELGQEVIPVYEAKRLSKVQKKAYRRADDRLALKADWDDDPLGVELEFLLFLEFD